jgi:peroxisomal membrane protein 4
MTPTFMSSTLSSGVNHLSHELSAILGALIGGAKYGIKVRLPHALVMTLLFRRDLSTNQKIRHIVRLVLEHASNLAAFATIYKSILVAFKWSSRYLRHHSSSSHKHNSYRNLGKFFLRLIVDGPFSKGTHNLPSSMAGHPERPYHSLIAGACGGYVVWGRYSSVNQQIVLYLTSRVLVSVVKRSWEQIHGIPHHHSSSILQHPKTYPLMAAIVWGLVMVMFEESPQLLHPSLKASMDEIYRYQFSSLSSAVSQNRDQDGENTTS